MVAKCSKRQTPCPVLNTSFIWKNSIPLSGRYLGCSKGFDVNDYGFKTNGGTEDGYAAIKAAIEKVNTVANIDGDNLADCTDLYKYIIFVSIPVPTDRGWKSVTITPCLSAVLIFDFASFFRRNSFFRRRRMKIEITRTTL
jgi:hypothetical protein